ncbi:MAG: hypothetical protein MZU91_12150 [Desulfosudis oleivorans]|nr:hypothetical protein [Desulfosudis oleivorans]
MRDGYLHITDRKKDMIITGGFNVYPSEVEQVIWSHPAVQDCAVIGVPDEQWGEAVKAVVELNAGQRVSADELIALCKDRLGSGEGAEDRRLRRRPAAQPGRQGARRRTCARSTGQMAQIWSRSRPHDDQTRSGDHQARSNPMTPIYVAGIAMTVFGRHPERSLHDLAGEALHGALEGRRLRRRATSASPTTPASPTARCRARSRSRARWCSARSASRAFPSTTSRTPARRAARRSTSRCRA